QPKFAVDGLAMVGTEALVRWLHPEKGLIPPGIFIPVAEETGLIAAIGAVVLREAMRQTVEWARRGVATLPVAVNLSIRQLQ
ncbi:EAL domain-containing protein, partial [bacterium]|nr:EAL domain-containing protein [bacterium]